MNIANNIKSFARRLVWGSALLATVPAVVGCQNRSQEPEPTYGDRFRDDSEPRHLNRIEDAQAASGARADGTLHVCHFDTGGGNPAMLNSLGEEKLSLMLISDASLPLVLNLDVPSDDTFSAREQSVRVFLKDRGLTDAQVKVVAGPNLRNSQPVAPLLAAQAATNAGSATAGPPAGAGPAALSGK